MNLRTGSARSFYYGSEHSCVLQAQGLFLSATAPRRLDGPWIALLFLFSCTNQRAGFLCLFRKKRRDVAGVWGRTGCALSKVLGFDFFLSAFLAVAREKESERLGHIVLPFFFFTLLCVLGSMLIDGLHIPIVTSLRRLSTVGCGGMGATCLKKTDGPYQSTGARGTADRIDTSPGDYYYNLAGQARHFGIATLVVRILGDGLEDQKWGVWWEGGPEVLFDLCPGLRLFSGEGGAQHEASRRRVY